VEVGDEHPSTFEDIKDRYVSVGAGHACLSWDLHHRQPTSSRGDRVACARVCFLADEQLIELGLPPGAVDYRWQGLDVHGSMGQGT
jgi:hypothetical protein